MITFDFQEAESGSEKVVHYLWHLQDTYFYFCLTSDFYCYVYIFF